MAFPNYGEAFWKGFQAGDLLVESIKESRKKRRLKNLQRKIWSKKGLSEIERLEQLISQGIQDGLIDPDQASGVLADAYKAAVAKQQFMTLKKLDELNRATDMMFEAIQSGDEAAQMEAAKVLQARLSRLPGHKVTIDPEKKTLTLEVNGVSSSYEIGPSLVPLVNYAYVPEMLRISGDYKTLYQGSLLGARRSGKASADVLKNAQALYQAIFKETLRYLSERGDEPFDKAMEMAHREASNAVRSIYGVEVPTFGLGAQLNDLFDGADEGEAPPPPPKLKGTAAVTPVARAREQIIQLIENSPQYAGAQNAYLFAFKNFLERNQNQLPFEQAVRQAHEGALNAATSLYDVPFFGEGLPEPKGFFSTLLNKKTPPSVTINPEDILPSQIMLTD